MGGRLRGRHTLPVAFIPLSQRTNPDPSFEGPHEGLPPWLTQAVLIWLEPYLYVESFQGARVGNEELLRDAEISLRLAQPLDWRDGGYSAARSVRSRIGTDSNFALDIMDFMLMRTAGSAGQEHVESLNQALTAGGSAWEARPSDSEAHFQLVRRATGPVLDVIKQLQPASQRAHAHLSQAWTKLMGRNPDPSGAYREAIRAVEVVAAPVVTPEDKLATLGKIIGALRDKPEKWTVDLVGATPTQVTEMAAMIWQSQFDRHGTHDATVPLNVSQEQADAAVHIAIALVRLFVAGHITHAV